MKYTINFSEESRYAYIVEANSVEEAKELFQNSDPDEWHLKDSETTYFEIEAGE